MAQRTAFLNSDAKGFNKDFHHTWINNYMLKQPGVMFSNYTTKPEFALGNGQISGGKAIIRCTRTTGTFAGEEILACFESTSTENISTAGNKKVYIEIPEVYVNDSTAITDSLTQGANLNVGRIVSSDSYPTHSNYIKLWEISNGDWQNATDLRPEVLRRGKPNTISYFGGNGEEERIDIDNSSLNKYLMSNGAGVAPTWEEGGGGGGGSGENFKRTFTADENLLAKSMFGVAKAPTVDDVNAITYIGRYSGQTKNAFCVILNGESFSSLSLNMSAVNSPADTVTVRIETVDSNGFPTGTLVDVGAYGTVTPTSEEGEVVVNLSSEVSGLTAHTKVAVVIQRDGSVSSSNYFTLGTTTNTDSYHINKMLVYSSGFDRWTYLGSTVGCVDCDGFASDYVLQCSTGYAPLWVGYCETGASAGNDFTGILAGTVDYSGATLGTKYYITTDGTLVTFKTAYLVGECIEDGVLRIGVDKSGQTIYDAIVASDGSGDYTTLYAAITAGKRNIFIREGNYTETPITLVDDSLTVVGANPEKVVLNYTITAGVGTDGGACIIFSTSTKTSTSDVINHTISGITFNISETGTTSNHRGYLINASGVSANPNYNIVIDNCNVFITQSGASIYFIDMTGTNKTICNIYNSSVTVTSTSASYDTAYRGGGTGIFNYVGCSINISSSADAWVYMQCNSSGIVFQQCNITVENKGTGKADATIYNADNCNIKVIGTSSGTATYSIQKSTKCNITVTKPLSDLKGMTASTEVNAWASSTSYSVGQFVEESDNVYCCKEAHTSGDYFDYSKRDGIGGQFLLNNIGCTATGGLSIFMGYNIGCVVDCDNALIIGDAGDKNAGAKVSGTTIEVDSGFVKLIGGASTFCGNTVKSRVGVRYQDFYNIIKDNYLTSDISSSQSVTLIGTNNNHSKVSDNIIRTR